MELYRTSSGEYTLYLPDMDETYHSRHGAIAESEHVFIKEGLIRAQETFPDTQINIFEVGFGTGLNALLAAMQDWTIYYHSLEPYPIARNFIDKINYGKDLENEELFLRIHDAEWDTDVEITERFTLHKSSKKLQDVQVEKHFYHTIFFDAFGPKKQEELWEEIHFNKLFTALVSKGNLTTYSAAGHVKRKLRNLGFSVEHPAGANGKREMTVAMKP